ncbi:hypothetical protein N7540_006052 [Penicillium herquei]|nr:hypothetical protein N7540_006052 [Penicillium herquei]
MEAQDERVDENGLRHAFIAEASQNVESPKVITIEHQSDDIKVEDRHQNAFGCGYASPQEKCELVLPRLDGSLASIQQSHL